MNWNENDKKKQLYMGMIVNLVGICLIFGSFCCRGTNIGDFISGVMMGSGCGVVLVGVYVIIRTLHKMK